MLYDLVKSRRSIRKYQKKEVEKEKVDIILKSALLSPSSRGIRPWHFISVTDRKLLKDLSLCKEHGADFLADAPLAIVVLADSARCDVWVEDTSIAATIIQLTAQDLGLGSCWVQIRERYFRDNIKAEEHIKKLLDIPEQLCVECIIAIGYPEEDKKPYDEDRLLYDRLHFNKY